MATTITPSASASASAAGTAAAVASGTEPGASGSAAWARSGPAAVVAGLAALAAIALAHLLRPDLDPSWAPISDLALGGSGWAMTAGFLLWSLAGFLAAAAIRSRAEGGWAMAGVALLALAATGPLLAALFPADPMTSPTAPSTLAGTLHGAGAMLSDALPPAALLLTAILIRRRRVSRLRGLVMIAATALVWTAAVWLTAEMALHFSQPGAAIGPGAPVGWANRVHVAACIACFGALGWAAGTDPRDASGRVKNRTAHQA